MFLFFKITHYHVFKFNSADTTSVEVKKLSTDDEWAKVKLLKKGRSLETVRSEIKKRMDDPSFLSTIKTISEVHSAAEKNRLGYLRKNVIERFYQTDVDTQERYFECG